MAMITLRVSDDEKEWLQYMADFYGIPLSELIKKYSMEQLEDAYDLQVAEFAHKAYLESNKEATSMKEVLDEFGKI